MNDTLVIYTSVFWFIIAYTGYKINRYAGYIFALIPLAAILKLNDFFLPFYSALSSMIIIFYTRKQDKINLQSAEELENEIKEKENQLNNLKNETEELGKYDRQNIILYNLTKILSETLNINENISIIAKYIKEYISSDFSFYLYDDEIENYKLLYGKIYSNGQKIEIEDKDGIYAVFIINSNNENVLQNARTLSVEITPFIKRIYLFNKIEYLSQKDGLTGLYRRGSFNEKLEYEIIRAKNFKHTVGLMMVDIDHFKKINDTYGHQVGDEILKGVARILKDNVYETDFVARYGGEEFAVIMPRAQREGSYRKAEYIRQVIENTVFKTELVELKITISIGLAYYPEDASDSKELIEKADKALYYSKEHGRNQTTDYSYISD